MEADVVLPLVFMAIMGLALLAYVMLDGYDLGVGLLLPLAEEGEKEMMIAAAATNSLSFVLVGVVITLPAIIIYTFWVYRIFHGKTRALSYGDEGEG